jgi:hypothetical protein
MLIKSYFNGVGYILKDEKRRLISYEVNSIKELQIIIDHFDKYPLITQKRSDYLLFKKSL